MLENLQKNDSVQDETDVIFGRTLETGVYDFTIDMAYMDQSDSEATFVHFAFVTDDGNTFSENVYVTSGKSKGKKNTYTDKAGKEQYLPGFLIGNAIHEMVTGEEIAKANTKEKLVKAWNPEKGAEEPMKKHVLVDLLQQRVKIGLRQTRQFKQVNQDGKYVDSDQIITINEIQKIFDADTDQTMAEKREGKDAEFIDKWSATYAGKLYDKTGGAEGSGASTANPMAKKNQKAASGSKMFS